MACQDFLHEFAPPPPPPLSTPMLRACIRAGHEKTRDEKYFIIKPVSVAKCRWMLQCYNGPNNLQA